MLATPHATSFLCWFLRAAWCFSYMRSCTFPSAPIPLRLCLLVTAGPLLLLLMFFKGRPISQPASLHGGAAKPVCEEAPLRGRPCCSSSKGAVRTGSLPALPTEWACFECSTKAELAGQARKGPARDSSSARPCESLPVDFGRRAGCRACGWHAAGSEVGFGMFLLQPQPLVYATHTLHHLCSVVIFGLAAGSACPVGHPSAACF